MAGVEGGAVNATLEHIARKYSIDLGQKSPIRLPQIQRPEFARLFNELGFVRGAEIGVAQGHHAKLIFEANPTMRLLCVDIWDLYDGYNEYTDRIHRYYREAQERLAPYNVRFIKNFSMDALKDAPNDLDFVYIDGAHDFKNVAMDICEWSKKVRVGGIVAGHDYKHSYRKGYPVEVKHVVQAFCYVRGIHPWFVMDRPGNEAWFYVRQEGDRLI